jgi:hypothetical protein
MGGSQFWEIRPKIKCARCAMVEIMYKDHVMYEVKEGCEMENKLQRGYIETYVTKKNKCDFCEKQAHYDGRTNQKGIWAYMCEDHFRQYGVGLGLGKGQRLILVDPKDAEESEGQEL